MLLGKFRRACFATLIIAIIYTVNLAQASSDTDWSAGLSAYKLREFKTAAQYFQRAISAGKTDSMSYLYLGHSYTGFNDRARAVKAYSELAQKFPGSEEAKLAVTCLQRLDPTAAKQFAISATASKVTIGPLPPTVPGSLTRRWIASAMPLRVYFSEGLQLPSGLNGRILPKQEYTTVCEMLKNTDAFRKFPRNAHYTIDDKNSAVAGLAMWNQERSVTCSQTNSPSDADILVFYSDNLENDKAGICQYPWEFRQPHIIQMRIGNKIEYDSDLWRKRERVIAAHEFGHAFGLEHLPDSKDVMFAKESSPTELDWAGFSARPLSEGDRKYLKTHYTSTPGAWLLPVKPR